jgi:hypothetical protein
MSRAKRYDEQAMREAMSEQRKEGKEEGIEIGRITERRQIALNGLRKGYAVNMIVDMTDITPLELESLQEALERNPDFASVTTEIDPSSIHMDWEEYVSLFKYLDPNGAEFYEYLSGDERTGGGQDVPLDPP